MSSPSAVHHRTGSCSCVAATHLSALVDQSPRPVFAHRPRPPRPVIVPQVADRLIVGRFQTMNATRAEVEAVAVTGGWITATGSLNDLEGLKGPSTELVDLGDSIAYPGFVEPHMHYWASAVFNDWVDLDCRHGATFDEVLAKLKKAKPLNGWVLGTQFDPSLLPGEPALTRDLLDKIVPDVPVLVMNASMHYAYVNSKALELAGLNDDSPDPDGGFYGRADGHLDGSLGEIAAMSTVMKHVPPQSQEHLGNNLVEINRLAAAAGYTRTHDAGTGGMLGASEPHLLAELEPRLVGRVTYALLDQVAEKAMAQGVKAGTGTDMVRPIAWKIVGDGSNQGRSGYQLENYLNRDFAGHPNYDTDYLVERMELAHRNGWQMMIHANGDGAIAQAIEAYEKALGGTSGLVHRDRIEHCSLATTKNLEDMSRLGLSPSFLMNHVYYWGRAFADTILGPQRAARLDRMGTAFRLGLKASTHSDYTVTNFQPLQEIQTAVTRRMSDGGEVLNPDECAPVDYAIAAKTSAAAWQVHADDVGGTIEVGKLADLTVLDADPRSVKPDEIADIGVVRTIVGGKTVYSA